MFLASVYAGHIKYAPVKQECEDSPGKCGLCEGDCDSDAECAAGLVCFKRDGDEKIPGCDGDAKFGKDFCVRPEIKNGGTCTHDNTASAKCGIC